MHAVRTAVYIDGYNLYYGRLRDTAYKWLDVVALFRHIVRTVEPATEVQAVRFFTAPALARFASHGDRSMAAQNEYHRALEHRHPHLFGKILGSHVFEKDGTAMPRFVEGRPFDRDDTVRVWRLVEKKTDVNLAVRMYATRHREATASSCWSPTIPMRSRCSKPSGKTSPACASAW